MDAERCAPYGRALVVLEGVGELVALRPFAKKRIARGDDNGQRTVKVID